MNNVKTFSSKQDIHKQACEWISRFDRGLSEVEDKAFSDWVNISSYHRQSLFAVAQTWDELSVLNELSTLFPLRDNHVRNTKISFNRKVMGMAASVIFVVMSSFAVLVNSEYISVSDSQSLVALNAETTVGEHRIISLADGSVIHLNTDSLVSVDFTDKVRNVSLLRGEAHFEVAHDVTRPFIVKAAGNTVTAVGTAFNVQLKSEELFELLVTDGKVLVKNEIDKLTEQTKGNASQLSDYSGELMIAGQKALISQQAIRPFTLTTEQVQNDLAWQQGMLVFHGEPLSEALQEISRYTSVNFTLADQQVRQQRVAGYFKAGDIQGLLFALENNFNIVYSREDQQTIVLSAGKQEYL